MKLESEETERLRELHAVYSRLLGKAKMAALKAELAQQRLQASKEEILVSKKAWGRGFNSDYTELKKPDGA